MVTSKQVFTRIYQHNLWGLESKSGLGSTDERNRSYRQFVEGLVRNLDVTSVLDVGCGDWSFSRNIDWGGATYLGLDVVDELIERLNLSFAGPSIRFQAFDGAVDELPEADLLIMKDVLQHWPCHAIHRLLSQLPRVRFALLTNDRDHFRKGWRTLYRTERIGAVNTDIAFGDWRNLRLREPPFSLDAQRVMSLTMRSGQLCWDKEVLLWRREKQGVLLSPQTAQPPRATPHRSGFGCRTELRR